MLLLSRLPSESLPLATPPLAAVTRTLWSTSRSCIAIGMHLRNVAAVCLGAAVLLLWIRESTFVELNNGSFKSWTNYVYVNACEYNEYYFGARVSRRVPSRPLRDVNFIRLTDPRYGSVKRNKDIPPRGTCGATRTRWLRTGGHRTARYTSATRVERCYAVRAASRSGF